MGQFIILEENRSANEEFIDLLEAVRNGESNVAQRMQLAKILQADKSARAEFICAMAFEAMMMGEFPEKEPSSPFVPLPDVASQPSESWTSWGMLSAFSLALLCGLSLAYFMLRSSPFVSDQSDESYLLVSQVATVTSVSEASSNLWVGQRLPVGLIELPVGRFELTFDCGAIVGIEGPARINLESDFRAFVYSGQLTVRVPSEAIGFVIQTPTSHIRDLGTSFAIAVASNGETELHVIEGSVEARSVRVPNANTKIVVETQALLFRESSVEAVGFNRSRFRAISDSRPVSSKYVHWNFDSFDGGKTLDDSAKHALQLRLRGPIGETDANAKVSDGVFGESLSLEGDGRYAVSDYPGVAMHRARSVAFWIRLPTESAEFGCNCFLSWGVPEPQQKWEMVWNRSAASGQVGALRVDFGRGFLVGNTDLRDGLWHHIAVVFYGGDHADVTTHLKLYVDGRLETTTGRRPQRIETATNSKRSIPVTLGRYMDHRKKVPRSYFVGQIDELFIVEEALNPRQIVMLRESNQFQKKQAEVLENATR